ncbi:Oidioi.mRNA.OKI2018_I69.XSR.g16264.t1.cds [Oikopleura dioica]|uniref:Oidioi.mRNA.OKI2018_I69.PAR.g10447.t1.cds n=1 Tax=Oikopleura dioica TaxID=34765 RepID=A0ABN7SJH4_OIKDI|nr:Oidioi.mRNA.OKI2018_I69.PAR.g10447.t1.cds [Oikopleura dioica]CAG5084838.1 Oidioi.mRNA.OKI2018_I69.PAR.g10749.t1.cds [Oikopleura dioica]CAG5099114.1 Oidioi.mRNA.OKI2018_I69.XSR.g16264.t1.cds [Oikopleura dioica]
MFRCSEVSSADFMVQIEAFDFEHKGCGGVFHIDAMCMPLIDVHFPGGFPAAELDLRITVSTKQEVETEFLQLLEFCHSKKPVPIILLEKVLTSEGKKGEAIFGCWTFQYNFPMQLEQTPPEDCSNCGSPIFKLEEWKVTKYNH